MDLHRGQASARGGETSHGQASANRRRTRRCGARRRPAPSAGGEDPTASTPPTGPKPGDAERNAAQTTPYRGEARYASGHPSNYYRGLRRFNHAVTHPSTTAGRDDLTPILCNIWSSAGPDALTEWSPIHLLPQAGTI